MKRKSAEVSSILQQGHFWSSHKRFMPVILVENGKK